jgi:hypothetical protein
MEYPQNNDNYIMFENDGIKVYINKNIKAKNNLLTLRLSGFLMFKSIEAYGIDMDF